MFGWQLQKKITGIGKKAYSVLQIPLKKGDDFGFITFSFWNKETSSVPFFLGKSFSEKRTSFLAGAEGTVNCNSYKKNCVQGFHQVRIISEWASVSQVDKMQARKIILKHHFDGEPTLNNFELIEETLSATLRDGGKLRFRILCKVVYLNKVTI